MQIICSKRLFFERSKSEDTFTVAPAPGPQVVPDWVANDRTYKANLADGSIVELAPSKVKPVVKPAATPVVKQVEPVSVAANWPVLPPVEANGLSK